MLWIDTPVRGRQGFSRSRGSAPARIVLQPNLRVENRQDQHGDKDDDNRRHDEIACFDGEASRAGACAHDRFRLCFC